MEHSQEFARNTKALLQVKGISANELARQIKVAPSTMSGYLNGYRAWPLDKAVICMDYLAKDLNQMLGRN